LSRLALLEPSVALQFELMSQILSSGFHNSAVGQHMHKVWDNVAQKPLVMSNQYYCPFRAAELVDPLSNRSERVYVEPRIGLVENCQLRFEYRHLKNLIALFLAT